MFPLGRMSGSKKTKERKKHKKFSMGSNTEGTKSNILYKTCQSAKIQYTKLLEKKMAKYCK